MTNIEATSFGPRRLFDNLRDAVAVVAEDGHIVLWNRTAHQVLGYNRDDMADVSFKDMFPDPLVAEQFRLTLQWTDRPDDDVHTVQRTVARGKSGEVGVEVSLCPIEDAALKGAYVLAVMRELEGPSGAPEWARREQDQTREITRLRESEIAQREQIKGLSKASSGVSGSSEDLAKLVSVASHEMGSPLTALRLQFGLLRASIKAPTEAQDRAIKLADRSITRMLHLNQDLHDVVHLESGRLRVMPQRMDLAQAVRNVGQDLADHAAAAKLGLEVRIEEQVPVVADPQRVEQVLTNLIENALKFTPPGGRVVVSCESDGGSARVEVADTGVGLRSEDQGRIFQAFRQVGSQEPVREGTPRGSGLGLFIAKGLVERQGGHIGCESNGLGQGSTFWFELPIAA